MGSCVGKEAPKKKVSPKGETKAEPMKTQAQAGSKKPKEVKATHEDKENVEPAKESKKPKSKPQAEPEPDATPKQKSPKPEEGAKKKNNKENDATVEPKSPKEDRMTLEEATAETEALYKKYRGEADEHAKLRSKYMEESKAAFEAGDKAKAKELSEKGKEEGRLMDEAGLRAARAIFKGKNEKQPDGTIDLHGLHVKEAEMIVKEELAAAKKKGLKELKIIIGAGHHSGKEGPKVGPAIKKLLDEAEYKWEMDETNASGGALVATL